MDKLSTRIGADWKDILSALRLDERIGKYSYIQPGLGLSGGNLERDLKNITNFTKNQILEENYFDVLVEINSEKKIFPIKRYQTFKHKFGKPKKISILGVVYKDNTNSFKNSPTIQLMQHLRKDNNFFVFFRYVKQIEGFTNNIFTSSLYDAIKNSDVIFIMSPLKEFNDLEVDFLNDLLNCKLIVDPFRVIKSEKINTKRNYFYN